MMSQVNLLQEVPVLTHYYRTPTRPNFLRAKPILQAVAQSIIPFILGQICAARKRLPDSS